MLEREQVEATIDDYLVDHFNLDRAKINDDLSLEEDLDADSIDRVELLLEVEDYFDLDISDEDAETFKTIGDLEDYIVVNADSK